MKTTLSASQAADILLADDNANWSYRGAHALVEWFEELEIDGDTPIEMDRIAIRCDYSEYDSLASWATEFFGEAVNSASFDAIGFGVDSSMSDDDRNQAFRDYIADNGHLIEFDGGIIVSSF